MASGWRWMLATGFLGACVYPGADEALDAQRVLIGMPKETLLSCAGPPDRQAAAGNLEYFTYQSRRAYSYPISGGDGGPYGGHYVGGAVCEATFTLRHGTVERLVYRLPSSGNWSLSQCHTVTQNCLASAHQ